jgi:hypothetical protein|tara:strand:+ start:539 stop:832 length:294 start_codon:yes stop_codon:yes gene_type:complete
MIDYLQRALTTFNGGMWYGWKTHDDDGNKIPNKDRMQYKYIKIIKDGATMPTEAEVNAKIQELKDAETARENLKASAKAKLIAGQPLTEEEADTIVL